MQNVERGIAVPLEQLACDCERRQTGIPTPIVPQNERLEPVLLRITHRARGSRNDTKCITGLDPRLSLARSSLDHLTVAGDRLKRLFRCFTSMTIAQLSSRSHCMITGAELVRRAYD